jgi:LCP family protein required for cell wall assembly
MSQPPDAPAPRPHGRLARSFVAISATLALLITAGSAYGMRTLIHDQTIGTKSCGFKVSCKQTTPKDVSKNVGPCAKDVCNYLLLGSDSRAGLSPAQQKAFGTNGQSGAGLNSDVIMLVHTDPQLQKAIVVSFPRDLWVHIPGHGMGKINSSFGLGGGINGDGPLLVARTVSDLTGLKINHFLYVDLKGFEGVVQTLGGVDMCIPAENVNTPGWLDQETATGASTQVYNGEKGHIVDPNTGLDVLPGCQRLDALQALAYVRSRHLPCDQAAPDFYRIARQQQFLHAVLNRLLQPSELLQAPRFVGPILGSLRRDSDLSIADLVYLVGQIKGIGTGTVEFRTVPAVDYHAPTGEDALAMTPVADQIFAAIKEGKPLGDIGLTTGLTPPSPAQITVPVVDDASGANAQSVWKILSDSGFNIAPAPVSSATYSKTVPGNVIAYAPGQSLQAQVVHQYLPGLEMKEVKGLPDDVAVFVTSSYKPAQVGIGNNGGTTSKCVGPTG